MSGRRKLLSNKVLIFLFVVSCGQPGIETYGCACDSRTYTQQELDGYRAGAQRGDLKALAEMQEYYGWRADGHTQSDPAYIANMRTSRMYFERRLSGLDPKAVSEFVDETTCFRNLRYNDGQTALADMKRAYQLASKLSRPIVTIDCNDDKRRNIEATVYLQREIKALEARLEKRASPLTHAS